jgi:8-oxo-dGTP pyrophosphatase MutT (NUDIX family)
MRELYTFDEQNYNLQWHRVKREAVRAIIWSDNDLLMVKSGSAGFYKFPGGGIKVGETHEQALFREVEEEIGALINIASVKPYGMIREIRKGLYEDEIFEQLSYYYVVEITTQHGDLRLDDYEYDLQYQSIVVSPQIAYDANMLLGKNYLSAFLKREAYVLNLLMNETTVNH